MCANFYQMKNDYEYSYLHAVPHQFKDSSIIPDEPKTEIADHNDGKKVNCHFLTSIIVPLVQYQQ